MNFKAVIFDLDGLLLDTEPYWTKADNEILAREGFKLTPELIRKRLGIGAMAAVEMYHDAFPFKYPFEDFVRERREITFGLIDKRIPVMERAPEFVKKCFEKGLNLAIATTAPHEERMSKILHALRASKYISVFVTGTEVERQKPSPDIYLHTAKKLGVDPQECLVIEDAPGGVEAGKAAGMVVYGVNADSSTRDHLQSSGANKIFSSLSEIDINKI